MEQTTGNTLGMAILAAFGIDPSQVTKLSLECESGEMASLTVTRHVISTNRDKLLTVLDTYQLTAKGSATVEFEPLSPQPPTSHPHPLDLQGKCL